MLKNRFNPVISSVEDSSDGLSIDIYSRICYYNAPNLNGLALVSDGTLDEHMKTLINTPVVAYYYTEDGIGKFGGHECWIDWDDNFHFGTTPIGVTTEVELKIEAVKPVYSSEEIELPVLYAKSTIWKTRFPAYTNVLKRLLSEGNMGLSWELQPNAMEEADFGIEGIPNPRQSDNYDYLGFALLGGDVTPAYKGTSEVVEISETAKEIYNELSSALKEDLANNSDNGLDKETSKSNPEKGGNQMDKVKELEAVVAEKDSTIAEMQAKLDEVTAQVEQVAKEQEKTLAEEKAELEGKLVEASEKVATLSAQVEELTPFKEKVEAMEAEKAEAEKLAKIEELKAMATLGGYITEKELEEDEAIMKLIAECDENGIKLLKAERVLASIKPEVVETSQSGNKETLKKELSEDTNIETDAMSKWLKG